MLPNSVKSNGLWANNVRPCGYARPKETVTINPARNSHPPNPDFHRRTPPARRPATVNPATVFNIQVNRPSARCRSAMPPSSGGTGSRLNSPSRALAPASRYAPSGFASAVSAKLAGQAQGVHRAAGQPNDKKVSALMYSRRQQENGEHAALIRAPERSHEHKKAVADLNPAHSVR